MTYSRTIRVREYLEKIVHSREGFQGNPRAILHEPRPGNNIKYNYYHRVFDTPTLSDTKSFVRESKKNCNKITVDDKI